MYALLFDGEGDCSDARLSTGVIRTLRLHSSSLPPSKFSFPRRHRYFLTFILQLFRIMSDYELSDPEDDVFYDDEDEEMDVQEEGKWSVVN